MGPGADSPCQGEMARRAREGRVGEYGHVVPILSRPRGRFGSFAAMGKGTRRPQAAKSSAKTTRSGASRRPRPTKKSKISGAAGANPALPGCETARKTAKSPCDRNEENHMSKKEEKTNVMRVLEQKKIPYTPHTYPHGDGEAPDGVTVAQSLGLDPDQVFKTLVTKGASGGYYVFDIPVAATLDLKKAAKAVGEKSIAMLHSKELLPLTGYVHGGCSPIGMKKQFPTVFHRSALDQETIFVSAGKIGFQVELSPADLMKLVRGTAADVTAAAE